MSDNQNEFNQSNANQQNVKVHVAPDLDYSYRDVANIFVGADRAEIYISYLGFETMSLSIDKAGTYTRDLNLSASNTLETINITGEKYENMKISFRMPR